MIRSKLAFALIASISMISFTYMFSRVSFRCCDEYRIPSKSADNINNDRQFKSSLAIRNNQSSAIAENTTDDQFVINSINLIEESEAEQLSPTSSVRDDIQYQQVLRIDSFLSVPVFKPTDSKLLYPQDIRGITSMVIDHVCEDNYGSSITVVVLVITRVDGFPRRDAIRRTWAKRIKTLSVTKLFFAVGLSNSETLQKTLTEENAKFGDILQWNFIDHYYNLTVKSLGILRWVSLNCYNTKFIYKVDDDCVLNIDKLIKFTSFAKPRTIYGYLWKKAFVDRNRKDKFFISHKDYPRNSYPDYTGGPWLVPGVLVSELYETAITNSLPALPYEDVYITGVVANKLSIKRALLPGLVLLHSNREVSAINYCLYNRKIIFWQCFDDRSMLKVWSRIQATNKTDCSSTYLKRMSKIATKLRIT